MTQVNFNHYTQHRLQYPPPPIQSVSIVELSSPSTLELTNGDFSRGCLISSSASILTALTATSVVHPLSISFYCISGVTGLGLLSETSSIISSDNCQSRSFNFGCGLLIFPCLLILLKDALVESFRN